MLSAATTFFGIGVYAVLQCALPVYEASKLQDSQMCNVNPSRGCLRTDLKNVYLMLN